jgi:hypothetical protein
MKPYPPQPKWLYDMIYGYSEFQKWRLLIDGVNFAIVQTPGGTWGDNSGTHYGKTSYYLVDKRSDPRHGHGMQYWKELKHGGRIGAKTKREWKALVDASDKVGTFANDKETMDIVFQNFVDNLAVYVESQRNEAEKMRTGKLDPHGCSTDYWSGHVNAFNCTLRKLRELVPGLLPEKSKS